MLHFQDVSQVIAIEECFGLVWCDQIMFFTHHLPCAARSEFINMLSTLMLISGSKPYRARHTGTIASGLIKKTNWSRLVDIDQGTMIKTTFNNNCKLIKMIKWICDRSEKSDPCVRFKQMSQTNCMFNKLSLKIPCKVCNTIKGYSKDLILLSDVNLWQVWEVRSICQI